MITKKRQCQDFIQLKARVPIITNIQYNITTTLSILPKPIDNKLRLKLNMNKKDNYNDNKLQESQTLLNINDISCIKLYKYENENILIV